MTSIRIQLSFALGISLLFSVCLTSLAFTGIWHTPQNKFASLHRQLPKLHSTASNGASSSSSPVKSYPDKDTIISFASSTGISLSLTTLGPGYRVVARSSSNETQIVGYCEGFIRPGGNILHIDKMEVFKKSIQLARDNNPDFTNGGTVFGVGLLIGLLGVRHGFDEGCTIAEFLAIDDGERQHKRLVRHYQRLGLNVIRYVGEDIKDIPDRMVWGGVGTLMNSDIKTLLSKHERIFTRG